MNVKPGDLAIQIKSKAGNEGSIVEILGPMGMAPVLFEGNYWCSGGNCFVWLTKGKAAMGSDGVLREIMPRRDAWLRPVYGLPDTSDVDEQFKEPA